MPIQPQYTASKHALVGLTRAAGPIFLEKDRITVNCICPAFVETNLCPPHIKAIFPKEHITPMSTVLKAFDTFIDKPAMTGQTLELSLENMYFRKQPDWANESQRFLGEGSADIWEDGYKAPVKLEITA
jgi:15-hydroxyprostaglandin dehydrogenase (NAD)